MIDNNYAQCDPCVVCGVPTEWACSDCGIDSGGKRIVRVCTRPACRDFHEAEQHTIERLRAAVDAERAAVVAWLRKRHADTQESDGFEDMYDNAVSCTYRRAADDIERGEHRREEEP